MTGFEACEGFFFTCQMVPKLDMFVRGSENVHQP